MHPCPCISVSFTHKTRSSLSSSATDGDGKKGEVPCGLATLKIGDRRTHLCIFQKLISGNLLVSMGHFLLQTGADQALMEEATLSLGVQFKVAIHSVANAKGPLSGPILQWLQTLKVKAQAPQHQHYSSFSF